jgi:hypothetical protein
MCVTAIASMGSRPTTDVVCRTIKGVFDSSSAARRRVRLLLCCGLMAGCSSSDRASSGGEQLVKTSPLPGGRRVRATLYETNQHTETTTVVRTKLAWDSMWQRISPTPAPVIDFDREMLVVAGLGMGGWDRDVSIRIDGSRADSLIAIVHIRDGIPSLCILDGGRAPAEIVRVVRDPRPVSFRREVEHLNCGR